MSTDPLSEETWRRLWSGTGALTGRANRTPDIRRLQALASTLRTLQSGADADGLAPSQRLAVHWALSCIADHRVALIADATGSGKTHVALATARALNVPTVVICPRPLVTSWRATAAHMQFPVRVLTWGQLRRIAADEPAWAGLAILDEAHHLRNPASGVSNAALKWLLVARTLLLSATPVFNGLSEAQHLLGITLSGAHAPADGCASSGTILETAPSQAQPCADSSTWTRPIWLPSNLTSEWLDNFLLHRTATQQRHFDRAAEQLGLCTPTELNEWTGRPRTVHHVVPERDAETTAALHMISRVVASLSSEAGSEWLHRTLLRRLASSTSALLASLRALRGYVDAGRRAALEGRRLQRRDYRRWMQVEEPGMAEQQVLSFFLDDAPGAGGFTWNDQLQVMDQALAHAWPRNEPQMRQVIERFVAGAAVVFTDYRATARAWFEVIRAAGGAVTRITGDAAFDSQWGRLDMEQALELFARGRSGPRVLVTTSVLSEGVNLPMANVVIHADLPWTPARLQQRNGRLDRRGETRRMHVVMLQPPPALEERAHILDTLLHKEAAHRTLDRSLSAGDGPRTEGDEPKNLPVSGILTTDGQLAQQPVGDDFLVRWTPCDGGQSLVRSLVECDQSWRWVTVPGMSGIDIAPMLPWCAGGVSARLPMSREQPLRFDRRRVLGELERVSMVLHSVALAMSVPERVRLEFAQQRWRAEQRDLRRRQGRRELLAMSHRLSAHAATVGHTEHVRWWSREFVAALSVPPRLNELEIEERWLRAALTSLDSARPTEELREWVQTRQQFGRLLQDQLADAFRGPWLVLGSNELAIRIDLEHYLSTNSHNWRTPTRDVETSPCPHGP